MSGHKLNVVRIQIIRHNYEISGQLFQVPNDWMVDNVIGNIELRLIHDNHRLDACGTATNGEITLDISYMVMSPVKGLLHDCVCITLDGVDKAFLGNRRETFDCIGPEPGGLFSGHARGSPKRERIRCYILTSHFPTDPFIQRARLVGTAKGIHHRVGLKPSLKFIRHIGPLIKGEEYVHQIAADSDAIWVGFRADLALGYGIDF